MPTSFKIPNSNIPNDDWWGYSKVHGWVVLDRNIPNNKPNSQDNLVFLRCSDWQHYEDTRENWNNIKLYNGANYFLKSLPNIKMEITASELEDLKRNSKKNEIYEKLRSQAEKKYLDEVEKKHKTFMQSINLSSGLLRKNINGRRVNNCYNCKKTVDNSRDYECVSCNWIICGLCGACGCGFRR